MSDFKFNYPHCRFTMKILPIVAAALLITWEVPAQTVANTASNKVSSVASRLTYRVWTSTNGATVRAALLSYSNETLVLKTDAGRQIQMSLSNLRQDDQQYLMLPQDAKDALAANDQLYSQTRNRLTASIGQARTQLSSALMKQRQQEEKDLKEKISEAKKLERDEKSHDIGFVSKGKMVMTLPKMGAADRKTAEEHLSNLPSEHKERSDVFEKDVENRFERLKSTWQSHKKQILSGQPLTIDVIKSDFEGELTAYSDAQREFMENAKQPVYR